VVSIQLAGGGSAKTYFAKNGVFERRLFPARRGHNPEPVVYWRKLDPIFIREDGEFKK
jgi:hypothetical protein